MAQSSELQRHLLTGLIALAIAGLPAADALAAKGGKGGGNAGGGNGGDPEPVYTADGALINGGPIDSTNISFNDIIFRPSAGFTFDLAVFDLSNCENFSAATTGTLVLTPGDSAAEEGAAELRFGFQGLLTNEKTAQYYLTMSGVMDPISWPPTTATTTMAFDYWEIAAENKKNQRSDCEGFGGTDVEFTIYRSSP
jgi:hypothetical protein